MEALVLDATNSDPCEVAISVCDGLIQHYHDCDAALGTIGKVATALLLAIEARRVASCAPQES